MTFPCHLRALKNLSYGVHDPLTMSPSEYATATLISEATPNTRYRTIEVTATHSKTLFTELALENAIKRGDFELA